MSDIQTLDQLLSILPECSGEDYLKIAKDMNIPKSDFNAYSYWDNEGYTRNCIARCDEYELILLCWNPEQETPIHCHNGEECWVFIVDGDFQEERYEMNNSDDLILVAQNSYSPGDLSYMNDNMGYHKLGNDSDHRAMSLHLYINPIEECSVYDEEAEVFIYRQLSYDTVPR